MKKIIFLLCLFLSFTNSYSQISNGYFKVIGANPCGNGLELESTTSLEIGDKIVIIQMNGAIIDRSNTENYGNIIDFNGAGQFEFNEVIEKNGNKAKFKFKIKEGYDFNAAVQLIKVENNKNLIVNSNPFVRDWNGSTGGVLVLYAEETITLASDIDVSGKGFRGSQYYNSQINYATNETKFFLPLNNDYAGNKGEGITIFDSNFGAGKGKNANGGGGGNACNSGGGGGGNISFGGKGGDAYKEYGYNGKENGLGGGLNVFQKYPLIMGGGGGSGHYNNNFGTDGGRGGAIVIIICKNLIGNNFKIISNGSNVDKVSGIDGAGGGGGGGSCLVFFENIINNFNFVANGGNGGSSNARGYNNILVPTVCDGPGGGGSGGTLYLNKESNLIMSEVFGGKSGIMLEGQDSCRGNSFGAMDGEIGKRLIYYIPIQEKEFNSLVKNEIISEDVDGDCGIIAKWLESKLIAERYYWYLNNESSIFSTDKRIYVSQSGKYKLISQRIDECKKIVFDTLEIDVNINSGFGEQKLQITTNKVYFEDTKQTIINTKEFGVKNISSEDYLLEKVYFAKNTNFSLPKSSLPVLIKPNETSFLKVIFLSNVVDNFKDTITILDNCKDLKIELETDNGELYLEGKNKCDLEWSIGEKNDNDSLNFIVQILPNISSDNLYITSNFKISEIQILNSIGELIHKEFLLDETNDFNLNIKNYENGLYYLQIKSVKNNHIFSKFIKIE